MKYMKVNYCCGHGSTTRPINGKNCRERDRRVDYLEGVFLCPNCWKLKQRGLDDETISMLCTLNGGRPPRMRRKMLADGTHTYVMQKIIAK